MSDSLAVKKAISCLCIRICENHQNSTFYIVFTVFLLSSWLNIVCYFFGAYPSNSILSCTNRFYCPFRKSRMRFRKNICMYIRILYILYSIFIDCVLCSVGWNTVCWLPCMYLLWIMIWLIKKLQAVLLTTGDHRPLSTKEELFLWTMFTALRHFKWQSPNLPDATKSNTAICCLSEVGPIDLSTLNTWPRRIEVDT